LDHKLPSLDHVAIAVPNLEAALTFWADALGLPTLDIEIVEQQGVRVAKLELANTHIELLEPLSAEFIASKGPGLHHVCLQVDDIKSDLSKLKQKEVKLIDQEPKIGAGGAQIAFVHPKATGGVLMELSQHD